MSRYSTSIRTFLFFTEYYLHLKQELLTRNQAVATNLLKVNNKLTRKKTADNEVLLYRIDFSNPSSQSVTNPKFHFSILRWPECRPLCVFLRFPDLNFSKNFSPQKYQDNGEKPFFSTSVLILQRRGRTVKEYFNPLK